MFKDDYCDKMAEETLKLFTLEEVLEMADLTDQEVLAILFREGHCDDTIATIQGETPYETEE